MGAPQDTTNLVAQIDAFGLEHLRLVERPLVPLRHHEIRIRVRAASLNYGDLLIALGQFPSRGTGTRLPLVPLSDCAGEVIEVGDAVDRFRLVTVSPARRCQAGLQAHSGPRTRRRRSGAKWTGCLPDTSGGTSVASS